MSRALSLAARGLYATDPNPRVGCVLVADGTVVSEGWHRAAGCPHAEIEALRAIDLRSEALTAYVTLEPCAHFGRTPPCVDALIKAKVGRVFAAMEDPNPRVRGRGLKKLTDAGIEVKSGLLDEEARALNPGFVQRMRRGTPWTRLKLAMSLDGRTALANGKSAWITGAEARADVQHLRARASIILTDAGTVRADNPRLNVRESEIPYVHRAQHTEPVVQPARGIISRSGSLPEDLRIADDGGPVILLSPHSPKDRTTLHHIKIPETDNGIDIGYVFTELGRREFNEVHIECGPTLAGTLLHAGHINELVCYVAPCLLGSDARPLAYLPSLERLSDRYPLSLIDSQPIGRDIRLTFRIA